MDDVPYEFCESVAESLGQTNVAPLFLDLKWRKAFKDFQSKRSAFICHLSDVNGTWKYAFQYFGARQNTESSYLTLQQLLALPHLQQMRIREISISRPNERLFNVLVPFFWNLDVEICKFLTFVLAYCSENFTTLSLKGIFHSSKDAELLDVFERAYFTRIIIWNYRSIHDALLRRHLPCNELTQLDLRSDDWPLDILEELRNHVMSDDFYSILLNDHEDVKFSFEVFESIFEKFGADRWQKKMIILRAIFEKSALEELKTYRRELRVIGDQHYDKSCFMWVLWRRSVLTVRILSSYGLWEIKHE